MKDPATPTVVDFARDIIAMNDHIEYLESEVARLQECERKYHELLDESVHQARHAKRKKELAERSAENHF